MPKIIILCKLMTLISAVSRISTKKKLQKQCFKPIVLSNAILFNYVKRAASSVSPVTQLCACESPP